MRRLLRIDRGSRTVDRDLDDELRFHFEMTVEELVKRGMTPDHARREAARRFGDADRHRENLRAIDRDRARRRRRVEVWSAVAQDVRYALRGLRTNPGLTAVVALTLGLGIGANATMFGIVDRLLLRPPAYLGDPESTHRVYLVRTYDGEESFTSNISYKRYLELSQWTSSFSQTAAFFDTEVVLGTGEEARELRTGMVSASFWPFFGARPALGRFFTPEEDRVPEGSPVAVLGYGYWQSKYAGSTDVVGTTIRIGRKIYTIIGVAPKGFTGMSMQAIAAFIPITSGANDLFGGAGSDPTRYYSTHNMSWMEMLVRRKPGVSVETATADLTAADKRSFSAQENAAQIGERRPHAIAASVLRERGPQQRRDSKVATWLGGVSLVVLLVACANVANILLARAFRRRREIAVRMALGISRGRLLAQLFTESLVLAVIGAAAGLLVAHWGGGVLRATLLPDVEWGSTLADARVLAFAGVAALAAGLLTGIAPAFQSARSDVTAALKSGGAKSGLHRSRLRTSLLVFQAALSVVLLVGAGLFVRSLRNVRTLDLGYDPNRIVYVSAEMRGVSLPRPELVALKHRLLARARQLPGVEHAGRTLTVPFMINSIEDLFVPGIDSVNRLGEFYLHSVSDGYFETMGTRILRGRGITTADRPGAPRVVVVSQSMAKKLWPAKDALGQCLKVGADTVPCSTVVGIAEDIRRGGYTKDEGLQYYVAIDQRGAATGGLFVRTRGDARRETQRIRRELQRLMPDVSYVSAMPLPDILDREARAWQLGATMFTIFGGLGLLLAAVGLYAVTAYTTAQRTHELGVRIALGAQTGDVVRLVVAGGLRVAVVGVAIGAGVALFAGRFIAPLLFDISPNDPFVFGVVAVTLIATAALASLVPAWRATRVDPNVALRTE
ncbi:MAG: ADOP family duplicated permease [Gemmatimonadaceae bacterium]